MSETDYQAVTQVQQKVWSNGDFARVASVMQIVGEHLAERADVMPGEKVLDVACGSGNIAIAAARRFADVTGLDYVPQLLETARVRAEAEGFPEIEWVEGDAQALPFDDASFDVVLSSFGVMFAPRPAQGRVRALARVQAGRAHRAVQLDAGGRGGGDVQAHHQARPAAVPDRPAGAVGHRGATARAARRRDLRTRDRARDDDHEGDERRRSTSSGSGPGSGR